MAKADFPALWVKTECPAQKILDDFGNFFLVFQEFFPPDS